MSERTLLQRKPYAPIVVERDGILIYYLPVESGFVSYHFEFQISEDHFHVLRDDEERYYFLFSALHHPFQLAATRLSDAEVNEYFDLVLFGDRALVENFLTEKDRESNGAISNLVRILCERDQKEMMAGNWFRSMF
ncbi:hypothetical protein [Paenibacillus tyrfis]|uniref:hypothetical protein n=1 Tax=Paenibacillus tyrfis TaxID=1501230 RepID=UPI00209E3CAE|nr:hypothetical protein [Paenibacillus tyrfis]MCP1308531.1 hypothetical protein [Paenibacillus tyrfis]